MNAIEIRGLAYRASRTFAIDGLDLTVPAGSVYGFLGANGSGKTTTIRLLLGLLPAARGDVRVLGDPLASRRADILARVGYVPERPHLYPSLTVGEMMAFHGAFHRRWDDAHADRLRDAFDLDPAQGIARLSKGQLGKLMMLLALAQRPDLLVLDEPTDGLDPVVRRDVLQALVEYVAQEGATVFISSHLVHELERICDWIGVVDRGRLVAEGPMDAFKRGIKRLRVKGAAAAEGAPFTVVQRGPGAPGEEAWIVRGWEAHMTAWFDGRATLREVVDLDLEEGFVEMLRATRGPRREEVA
jgi:ABC-2 type transport system ATP-binding protein